MYGYLYNKVRRAGCVRECVLWVRVCVSVCVCGGAVTTITWLGAAFGHHTPMRSGEVAFSAAAPRRYLTGVKKPSLPCVRGARVWGCASRIASKRFSATLRALGRSIASWTWEPLGPGSGLRGGGGVPGGEELSVMTVDGCWHVWMRSEKRKNSTDKKRQVAQQLHESERDFARIPVVKWVFGTHAQ